MLDDVEALEVLPHRMGRIGEAPVGEGIRRQQVAEFIVCVWLGHAENWDQNCSG
jgi:hypothetical protein